MQGVEAIANALKAEGVEFVAGVTGGSTQAIYDALHMANMRILVCRHERGAVDMADGYARTTGRPGVALVEQGPGAVNALAGIANSYADSVPVILLSWQVQQQYAGRNVYQENDLMELFRTVTMLQISIPLSSRIPEVMRQAFSVVNAPCQRPVFVEIPTNVALGECDKAVLAYEPLRQKTSGFDRIGPISSAPPTFSGNQKDR
jgi:acetolactate synthase-1/2/3 large subunit